MSPGCAGPGCIARLCERPTDEPRRPARQPRDARRADDCGGPALPEGVPVGPARRRDAAGGVVADPERDRRCRSARRGRPQKYAMVWVPDGSPLQGLDEQAGRGCCAGSLGVRGHEYTVATRCATATRRSRRSLDQLHADGCDRILVLPMYPQYSAATDRVDVRCVPRGPRRSATCRPSASSAASTTTPATSTRWPHADPAFRLSTASRSSPVASW